MSFRILALDTTSASGSFALLEDGRLLEELLVPSSEGYGHLLFDHIRELLRRHGWQVGQIDCFAAAAGPGSFTGIRVGLAAIKGLGEALGKPVAAISNLEALASFGTAAVRIPLIDARRGEVYWAAYSQTLELLLPEAVTPIPKFFERLPSGSIQLVCADKDFLEQTLARRPGGHWETVLAPKALAGAVGALAWRRFLQATLSSPAEAAANYVRLSDAELYFKD